MRKLFTGTIAAVAAMSLLAGPAYAEAPEGAADPERDTVAIAPATELAPTPSTPPSAPADLETETTPKATPAAPEATPPAAPKPAPKAAPQPAPQSTAPRTSTPQAAAAKAPRVTGKVTVVSNFREGSQPMPKLKLTLNKPQDLKVTYTYKWLEAPSGGGIYDSGDEKKSRITRTFWGSRYRVIVTAHWSKSAKYKAGSKKFTSAWSKPAALPKVSSKGYHKSTVYLDVYDYNKYAKPIYWMTLSHIAYSTSSNGFYSFKPKSKVSRGKAISVLYREAGKPTFSMPKKGFKTSRRAASTTAR